MAEGFVNVCNAHPVTRVGRAVAQGALDSAYNHLTYALEHPAEAALDLGVLFFAPEFTGMVALCRLAALAHHAYQHREAISAATQQFFNDIQNNAHHDPEWLAQNGQLFTQVYCDIFVSPQIGNKIMNTGGIRPLANGLKRQTEAVQACIRNNVNAAGQKACDGLKNILQNAGESLKTGNPQPAFAGVPGNASFRAIDDQANRAAHGLMKKVGDAVATAWSKLSPDELKKVGEKSLQSDIRQINGSLSDAFNFFKAQVETFIEKEPGSFFGKDKNGVIFFFRETSKFGPPTIDVNGIKGIRKIKFIKE